MKRIANLLLVASVALFVAAPALAKHARPHALAAVAQVTLNQPAPHYGDFIDFTVSTDTTPTLVRTVCSHDDTATYGGWNVHYETSYISEKMGLYAPNWESGGATCVTDLLLVTEDPYYTWTSIAQTGFVVEP